MIRKVFCLILISFVGLCRTCREEGDFRLVHDPHHEYDQYGNNHYVEYRNVTINMTITCSNLYSLGQISFNYENQNFEQYLIVKDSNIPIIHSLELDPFRNLTKLYLSKIHLKNILPGSFARLTTLRDLHLDNNELTKLSNGVYNGLQSLEVLDLTNNNIQKIDNLPLAGLFSLKKLFFGNNNLSGLNDNFFETLDNLNLIDLSGNPLETFPFLHLPPEVHILLLSRTQLIEMSSDLSHLPIRDFDLSSSKITKIDFSLFPKSDDINLSNNKIISLDNYQYLETRSLNLAYNEIEEISGILGEIFRINLSHNNFKFFNKSIFSQPSSIELLDLGNNQSPNFDMDFFHSFSNLETLSLRQNGIKKIETIWFRDLKKLTVLDLSGNLIEEFQFGVFDNLNNLQILNISSNKLKTLDHDRFHQLSKLTQLYLDYNQISSLDDTFYKYFQNLEVLSLDHNPWKCQELLKVDRLLRFLKQSGMSIIVRGSSYDVENFRGVACRDFSEVPVSRNSSNFSFPEVSLKMEKAIGDGIKNSKMDELFNQNFEKSKFVKYFDGDFSESNFFKFLNNFKFVVSREGNFNESRTEVAALQTSNQPEVFKILVFMCVVLALILMLAVIAFYVGFNFVKSYKKMYEVTAVSEMELC